MSGVGVPDEQGVRLSRNEALAFERAVEMALGCRKGDETQELDADLRPASPPYAICLSTAHDHAYYDRFCGFANNLASLLLIDLDAILAARPASAPQPDQGLTEERLRDLLAGTKEVVPYKHGDDVGLYCGKACKYVTHHVRMSNHNDPQKRLAVFCSTQGCMHMPKVSDLPKRYRVTEDQFRAEAARYVTTILAARPETDGADS